MQPISQMCYTKKMKVLLAQGNPGSQYEKTRHNIGWQCLDRLAAKQGVDFTAKPKFFADIAEYSISGEKILLVKPTTFYNETGRAARAICDFYKLQPATDMLILHDDLALGFGTLRTRDKGSDAGNNGIKSLNAHLGPHYWRLRIGIYSPLRDRMHDADFVLKNFSQDEQQQLNTNILPAAIQMCERFIAGNITSDSQTVTD